MEPRKVLPLGCSFKTIQMKNFFIAAISMAMVSSAFAQNQPQGTWYLGTADATDVVNIFSDGVSMSPTIGYAVADNLVLNLTIGTDRHESTTPMMANGLVTTTTLTPFLDDEGNIVLEETISLAEQEFGWSETSETRTNNFSLGAQYFFGDNFFVGAALDSYTLTTETTQASGYNYLVDADDESILYEYVNLTDANAVDLTTTETERTDLGFTLSLGKYIPVRENWYLTPQVGYSTSSSEEGAIESDRNGVAMSIGFGARF